jgi:hypothetical protein
VCSRICRKVTRPVSVCTATRSHAGGASRSRSAAICARVYKREIEFDVPFGVRECVEVQPAVGADEEWALHCDRALHTVGEELFTVGEVADDLLRAHRARDRVRDQLLARETRNRFAKECGTAAVARDELGGGGPIVELRGGDLCVVGKHGCLLSVRLHLWPAGHRRSHGAVLA